MDIQLYGVCGVHKAQDLTVLTHGAACEGILRFISTIVSKSEVQKTHFPHQVVNVPLLTFKAYLGYVEYISPF